VHEKGLLVTGRLNQIFIARSSRRRSAVINYPLNHLRWVAELLAPCGYLRADFPAISGAAKNGPVPAPVH
jgi:hypothetical protein